VTDVLLEAFRHHAWATKELLSFSRDLSEEQLTAPGAGTFGGIRRTFNHLILSDGGYLRAPFDAQPTWARDNVETDDFDELLRRVDEAGALWERHLSQPLDADRVLIVDGGAMEVRQGVILTQALHHGNAHREQISSMLTSLGLEPPDLQAWGWAEATSRIWPADRS